jgi:OHCU decarboxylase
VAGRGPLPPIERLDRLDAASFAGALAPLFEGAPRFLARLAEARPFGSYPALFDTARSVVLAMPEDEQLELIDSHPRIGASPGSMSGLSAREQGHDGGSAAEEERGRIQAALDDLNAAYEARFGFRFVIFVAGRSRAEVVPLMEERLNADRDAEKARAIGDVIAIARDRARLLGADASREEEA